MVKSMKKLLSLICFIIVSQSSLFSQSNFYLRNYSVYPEYQSFFFQPSDFSLSQLNVLKEVQHSFSSHFLSKLNTNPANLSTMQDENYFYIDLRSNQKRSLNYYSYLDYAYSNSYIAPPITFTEKEPLFSVAFFTTPFKNNNHFKTGITYQHININDSFNSNTYPFYGIVPHFLDQSSFTPQIGTNFSNEVNYSKYRGHFVSLFNSYQLNEKINFGVKLALTTFSNTGSFIPKSNGLNFDLDQEPRNFYKNSRSKSQDYHHWDISTGISILPTEISSASISIGYLNGTFDHYGNNEYLNSNQFTEETESYFTGQSNSTFRDLFEREGGSIYSNLIYVFEITSISSIHFSYNTIRTAQDLNFGNLNTRTSTDYSRYLDYDTNELRTINTNSYLNNESAGEGNTTIWNHDFTFRYDYKISSKINLVTGIQLSIDNENENTLKVQEYSTDGQEIITDENESSSTTNLNYTRFNLSRVITDYSERHVSTYIPIILNARLFKNLSIEAGVIRSTANLEFGSKQLLYSYEIGTETINGAPNPSPEESEYTYMSNTVDKQSFNNWNTFGSLTFHPNDKLKFLVRGVSSDFYRGETFNYDSKNKRTFNFSISAEISF